MQRTHFDVHPNNVSGILHVLPTTQPCIHPGLLNRVPASAGVKAGKSPLLGQITLCDPIWHVISRSGVVISIRFTLGLLYSVNVYRPI